MPGPGREIMMQQCSACIFRNMNCLGEEADFILEVLIRIRPEIGGFCALFDSVRIEPYRQLREHLGAEPHVASGTGQEGRG